MSCVSPYANLYHRLVANTAEPVNAQACWVWTGKRGGGGYARFNLWVPGLGTEITLMAHIALWIWLETSPAGIDEFYLFYVEFVISGLELDHGCVWPDCISPDHLSPVTPSENNLLRVARSKHVGR